MIFGQSNYMAISNCLNPGEEKASRIEPSPMSNSSRIKSVSMIQRSNNRQINESYMHREKA